jgi:hypothetical protein
MTRRIALVDHTTHHPPPDGILDAIAEALTIQVRRDFARAWPVAPTEIGVGGRGDEIHFFDSAHQASDYGWHVVDGHGLPYAHVFTSPSIANGSGWTSGTDAISATASHELLEMLADPAANEYAVDAQERLWSREVCDAVQENVYRIVARGVRVPVSNFVYPAYFNPYAPAPYDHLGVLEKPFSLAPGGYGVYERETAEHDTYGRRLSVTFDDAVPAWRRRQKLDGWGRTYWRLELGP